MVNAIRFASKSPTQYLRQFAVRHYANVINDGLIDKKRKQTGVTQSFLQYVDKGETIYQAFCKVTGTSPSQNPYKFLRLLGRGAEEYVIALLNKGEVALSDRASLTDMFTKLYIKVSGSESWDASPP